MVVNFTFTDGRGRNQPDVINDSLRRNNSQLFSQTANMYGQQFAQLQRNTDMLLKQQNKKCSCGDARCPNGKRKAQEDINIQNQKVRKFANDDPDCLIINPDDGGKVACAFCNKRFMSRQSLLLHRIKCKSPPKTTDNGKKTFMQIMKETNSAVTKSAKKGGQERNCVCPYKGCGKSYAQWSVLSTHLQTHTQKNKPYPCTWKGCKLRFTKADELGEHAKTHIEDGEKKKNSCPECDARFDKFDDLTIHMRTHGLRKSPRLVEKSKASATSLSVIDLTEEQQERKISDTAPAAPDASAEIDQKDIADEASQQEDKEEDEESSAEGGSFSCSFCMKQFVSRFKLLSHKISCATLANNADKKSFEKLAKNESGFNCKTCSKEFKSADELSTHATACDKSSKTDNKQSYACYICSKSFSGLSKFRTHVLAEHNPQKTAAKSADGSVADSKVNMEEFIAKSKVKKKAGDSDYSVFDMSEDEELSPSKKKPDEKMFSCHLCDEKIADKDAFRDHVESHNGEKLHTCDVCSMRFGKLGSLCKHMFQVHYASVKSKEDGGNDAERDGDNSAKPLDAKPADVKSTEAKPMQIKIERTTPDTKSAERKSSETKTAEMKSENVKAPLIKLTKTKAFETKAK